MIGQLITSFRQARENPTTTSTTCNQCAERAMVESKTAYSLVSHGATQDLNKGVGINKDGKGYEHWLVDERLNNKGKHTLLKARYPIASHIYWLRRIWHSHYKYKAQNFIRVVLKNKK